MEGGRDGGMNLSAFLISLSRNLSQTLNTLRQHRHESLSSNPQPQSPRGVQNGEVPVINTTNRPPQTKVAAALQSRVKLLEDHNMKLENYISQFQRVTKEVNISFLF